MLSYLNSRYHCYYIYTIHYNPFIFFFFFLNDPPPPEISPLPLPAALPIFRQSANRQTPPATLVPAEIKALIDGLALRERTLVLLAASTGLRQSEIFGLKWGDIDFERGTMSVIRSIVYGVVGPCKTESSQKPVPMHPTLADALTQWRKRCTYVRPEDWVFASKIGRASCRERV